MFTTQAVKAMPRLLPNNFILITALLLQIQWRYFAGICQVIIFNFLYTQILDLALRNCILHTCLYKQTEISMVTTQAVKVMSRPLPSNLILITAWTLKIHWRYFAGISQVIFFNLLYTLDIHMDLAFRSVILSYTPASIEKQVFHE